MIVIAARSAWAQPPPAAGAQPAPSSTAASAKAKEDEAKEKKAREHFDKAVKHFDKAEYLEAYNEYLKSLYLTPTRAAMGGAASSLKQLGRYDEALDMYEELRRNYPELPAKMEAMVGPAITELQGLVGTLVVAGDAPDGASLFIDDRYRGKLPLPEPLRVAVGSHNITVEKGDFDPITAVVELAARKENVVKLVAKSKHGRISVTEKHNWVLHVELDGKDVGETPWEGLVEPGEHRVRLHGYMSADALAACEAPEVEPGEQTDAVNRVKISSAVETVRVKLYEVQKAVLSAEARDASLKIESTPSGAIVMVDYGQVGLTPWEGQFGLGEHIIEVKAHGYLPAKQKVMLEKRKQRELSVLLERERKPEPQGFSAAARIGAWVAYGTAALGLGTFAVTGSLALVTVKDLKNTCPNDLCSGANRTRAQGLHNTAHTLGIVAPVALGVAGIAAAVGTVVVFAARPSKSDEHAATGAVGWKVGTGLGGLKIEGRFQ